MTDDEVQAFLDSQRVLTCATNGRDGFPHLMPLWYVIRDGHLWSWTYAASQKVKNLERDPRATVQVEAGEEYQELRGVMQRCTVEMLRDIDNVAALGGEIFQRYSGSNAAVGPDFLDVVRRQAEKRVALHFMPVESATWDHRKLGQGVY